MRALGIDLGARRIGVAVSDSAGVVASPYEVIERDRDQGADHAAISRLVDEVGAERVVVGLPVSLSGRANEAAQSAAAEAEALARRLPVPVETYDERLTTVAAERSLAAAGVRSKARRRVVDKAAAAVMLQSWLDRRARSRP